MAWVVEADGVNDEMQSTTLGDLTASKLRVVSTNVTWNSTGYLWSQALSQPTDREFGLWITSTDYRLYAGGSSTTLANTTTYPIADVTVDLTVDYVANTAILIIDGVTAFSGAITAGTNRGAGTAFRFFARAGGYFAPSGTRVGNTEVYIDDVLDRDYDFDGSSHGSGTVTVNELEVSADATGVNMPTDGSAWVDLGGGLDIAPTGITSEEALGTSVITTGAVDVSPVGIASSEAFGSATLSQATFLSPSGIASEEAFGAAVLSTGAVTVSPSGIASTEAFGSPVLTQGFVIQPTGIASSEAFGTAVITTGAVTLSPTGISSAEVFGSHNVAVAGAKEIKIDFQDELVIGTNLQSRTLYYNGDNYFTVD